MKTRDLISKTILILAIILLNNVGYSQELFYKDPIFDTFKKSLSEYSLNTKDKEAHSKNIVIVFTTKVLEKNPTLMEKIIKDYKNFSTKEQEILTQSLQNVGNGARKDGTTVESQKHDLLNESSDISKYANHIYDIDFITKNIKDFREEDLIHNSLLADYLWVAFYATGEEKYITKMLNFIDSWPKNLKEITWEMLNRDMVEETATVGSNKSNSEKIEHKLKTRYEDIFKYIKNSGLANANQLKSIYIVLWSLDSNRRQHPELKNIIKFNQND